LAVVDALSHMLGAVRLTEATFFSLDATSWPPDAAPARAAAAELSKVEQVIECHLVTSGTCWGGLRDEPPIQLEMGDVVVFPHGGRRLHTADRARLICGFLGFDAPAFNPLLATLPRVIHLRAADQHDSVLNQLIELSLVQASSPTSGRSCVLSRLGELLFAEIVRRYLVRLPEATAGWFAGLRDENIGRALQQMHGRPAHAWTLGELAKQSGLSRSMLAERFLHIVGVPPIQYLAKWRIQLAASLLRASKCSVAEVAERVGYGSEAALSRAFKRCVGLAPARYRQGLVPPKLRGTDDFGHRRETSAPRIRTVAGMQRQTA
jgi:AraC-like DNA-binding protein